MKKKRHLTPQEIIAQCKQVARESRMAERTPWTAMAILCFYVLMEQEGFKAQRIMKIHDHIDELEERWRNGEVDVQSVSDKLMEKAEWTIEYKEYTEQDIVSKKGSYEYWLDKKQIEPQNTINQYSTRYMLFFFDALIDVFGFGKTRLTRLQESINDLLLSYQQDKTSVKDWSKALFDKAGLVMEMPIDPLTQTSGSMMTGC